MAFSLSSGEGAVFAPLFLRQVSYRSFGLSRQVFFYVVRSIVFLANRALADRAPVDLHVRR